MKHILITTIAAVLVVGCGGESSYELFYHSITNANIEAVEQHIAAGADVNAKSSGGSTPLYVAALGGHKEITELLIAEGADVNAKSESKNGLFKGRTPLDSAEYKTEIAELLRKHGGKTGEELKAEGK